MDLELTPDLEELRDAVCGVLDRHAPLELARNVLEGTGDASPLWAQLAELGWYEIGLDADDPFGVVGVCMIAQELGRRAAPSAFVDMAVIVRMLRTGGATGWAERLADGSTTASLALVEPGGTWGGSALRATGHADGGDVVISGEKTGVHHARAIDRLAVVFDLDGEPALALVDAGAPGVTVTPTDALDAGAAPARVELANVRASAEDVVRGLEVIAPALAVGTVATAAEGLGAASAAVDLAVAYALDREQFGRPIGSFQAIKHILAEIHALRETTWASVYYAAAALDEGLVEACFDAEVAKAQAARATREIAEGALQVLGGIGVTWEHDFHLLQRRVLECEQRFGAAGMHEERILTRLAAPAPSVAAPGA